MKTLESILVWGLFMASSVFGHVALKRAAATSDRFEWMKAFALWKDPWAVGAVVSWMASCYLWAVLLTRYGVGEASSHSSMRYVLILLAATLWLGESMTLRQGAGCVLISAGIWLAAKP